MSAIRIRTIATTPVKGTALDFPAAVQLGIGGVADNRSFHLIDERGHLPGAAVDVHPVTISSAESLAAVAEVAGADVDGRRFRMLIELEGGEPFEEEGWTGRTLRIGSARVRVGDSVGRCAVITQDPDTGGADLPLLKVLRDERRARDSAARRPRLDRESITFGVYATVTRAGRVSVGEAIAVA